MVSLKVFFNLLMVGSLTVFNLVEIAGAQTQPPSQNDRRPIHPSPPLVFSNPWNNTGSVEINTNVSEIDLQSVGADYNVTVSVDYLSTVDAALVVSMFDENTSEFVYRIFPVKGKGTSTAEFKIPKNSEWGQSIGDGSFDEAWVTAELFDFSSLIASAAAWISAD